MDLYEFQGKRFFADYGVKIPKGVVITSADELPEMPEGAVVKTQVLTGGRGKAGGVAICANSSEIQAAVEKLLGAKIKGHAAKRLLIEEKADIAREFYLSIFINRKAKTPSIMFSDQGGVNIESVPKDRISIVNVNPLIGLATPVNSSMSSMMDRAEVIDDSHVALYLKYAYKPVVNCLAQPGFCIINKAYYEQCQADGTNFSRKPMGTGAYQFVNWVSGEKVVFERFEDFHGEPAKIKNLTLLVMSDATTAALSIENGEVDAFLGVSTADKARLLNNPKVQVMQAGSAGHYVLTFNTRIAPYNDIKFRQAVALGINQEEVLLGGLDGDGWVITAPITLGYFGYPEGFEDNPYDPEKAKELLKEAGYEGQKVVLKTSTESWYSIPAQVIQEQLRKIGLDCELQIMERGAYDAEVF